MTAVVLAPDSAAAAAGSLLVQLGIWGVPLGVLLWVVLVLSLLRYLGVHQRHRENRTLAARCQALRRLFDGLLNHVSFGELPVATARRRADRALVTACLDLTATSSPAADAETTVRNLVPTDGRAERVERLLTVAVETAPLLGLVATSAGYCELLRSAAQTATPTFAALAGPASIAPIATMVGLGIALVGMPALALLRPDVERQRQRDDVRQLQRDFAAFESDLRMCAARTPRSVEVTP